MTSELTYPISKIEAEEIKDSRGNPTIKVTVEVEDISSSFSVPSGASTGVHEAHELKDPEPEQPARSAGGARYRAGDDGKSGMGVSSAIEKVNKVIAPALLGKDVLNQKEIDRIMLELDGTSNKGNLGGNSMIGVSVACAKTAAKVSDVEVFEYLRTLIEIKPSRHTPYLFINTMEGGKHVHNDFNLAFQEYHVVPMVDDVKEAVDIGIKIQETLKKIILKELGKESTVLSDEGGFSLETNDVKKPLEYLTQAIAQNDLQDKVRISLDVAGSSFYQPVRDASYGDAGGGDLYTIDGKDIAKEELMSLYASIIKEFNIFAIEDPFYEEHFDDFRDLKERHKDLFVIGDDLTVTNKSLLEKAIKNSSINAMIIKPNQVGTLTETLETMQLARENDIELIIGNRSSETNDDFIADLAYAFNAFGLKTGSPIKSERMIKYKRLMQIVNY